MPKTNEYLSSIKYDTVKHLKNVKAKIMVENKSKITLTEQQLIINSFENFSLLNKYKNPNNSNNHSHSTKSINNSISKIYRRACSIR